METTVAKIVYSPCPPSSKDVIWGKTVNGKIEFQTFGNEGWNTVAKEDILKDIFQIKEEILEELEDYIEEVIPQADWNQVDGNAKDFIKGRIAYEDIKTLGTLSDDFDASEEITSNIEVEVGQKIRVHNSSIDITATIKYAGASAVNYYTANLINEEEQSIGQLQFAYKKLTGVTGISTLASAVIDYIELKTLDDKFIPATIARLSDVKDGISLDVVYCEDSTGYMFDRSKYYDVSTVTDVTFTIPAITKAEIYKGTLHSASITVPSETFITGDKSLLTISGTTITASSSEWYTWTYDSYTKEMKFSMYKEI